MARVFSGQAIKGMRKMMGLTAEEFADKAGITRTTLCDIENWKSRKRRPSIRTLERMMNRLSLNERAFFETKK